MLDQSANSLPDHDDTVEIPFEHKLRLERCPKCDYRRLPDDDAYASPFECPQCGVVYALAMEELRLLNKGQSSQGEAEVYAKRSQEIDTSKIISKQIGGAIYAGRDRSWLWMYILIGLGLVALLGWIVL